MKTSSSRYTNSLLTAFQFLPTDIQWQQICGSEVNLIQVNDFNEYSRNKAERLMERGRGKSAKNIYSLYLVKEVEINGTIRDA